MQSESGNQASGTFEGSVYYDRASAEDAVARLQRLGYGADDISVMSRDRERAREFAEATDTKAPEGTVAGGIVGGVLGAIVAGLTATGSIAAIAGTGGAAAPLVAGPLAAALAGLGAGAAAGGAIGALIGAGVPEERAHEYSSGIDRGGMLIGVLPRSEDRDEVRKIFRPDGTPASSSFGSIDAATTTPLYSTNDVVPRRVVR